MKNELPLKEISINALFNDGSSERVDEDHYTISDNVINKRGANKVVIIYEGYTDFFYIYRKP